MSHRDPIVIQAIRNVLGRQSLADWVRSLGRGVVEEIYEEVRRLDRVAIEQHLAVEESSRDHTAATETLIDDTEIEPV